MKIKNLEKSKRSKLAVKMFIVVSADCNRIISGNVFPANMHDSELFKKTNIAKRYRGADRHLPWFSRTVAGRKVRIPGHFIFDDQADKGDYLARKTRYFLGGYGAFVASHAKVSKQHRLGLNRHIDKWQKATCEKAFSHLGIRFDLATSFPKYFNSFQSIKAALVALMKLYNFVHKEEHEEAVRAAMESHPAEWVKPKDRGQLSIRHMLREQGVYSDPEVKVCTEYVRIQKK